MNKGKWIIVIILIVLVLGAAGYLIVRTMQSNTSNTMSNMDMGSSSVSTVATDKVSIKDFAFTPSNITVKKGTTVVWTNDDSASHTVTETDDLKGPNSSTLAHGQTYEFKFDSIGMYHYRCDFHPHMTGTVMVVE